MSRFIVRALDHKKSRIRAAKVLGLYNEKLGRDSDFQMGDPKEWFVVYEHEEKRSGLVVFRHSKQSIVIHYAAVEHERKGQLRALVAAATRFFDEPVSTVSIDIDDPSVWEHLGFTVDVLIDYTPHRLNMPIEQAFPIQCASNKICSDGVNPQDILEYIGKMQSTKSTRIIVKGIK